MRVLLLTSGACGDVEPMVGLAVRLRALGAQCATVAAVAAGFAARVSTGVLPSGGWR